MQLSGTYSSPCPAAEEVQPLTAGTVCVQTELSPGKKGRTDRDSWLHTFKADPSKGRGARVVEHRPGMLDAWLHPQHPMPPTPGWLHNNMHRLEPWSMDLTFAGTQPLLIKSLNPGPLPGDLEEATPGSTSTPPTPPPAGALTQTSQHLSCQQKGVPAGRGTPGSGEGGHDLVKV